MALVAPTQSTALPVAPSTSRPLDFDVEMDAMLVALPVFQAQENALAQANYDNALMALAAAQNAALSEGAASQSAAAAAASSGAPKWVSDLDYADGVAAYDPANGIIYRRVGAGRGTVAPSADPANWRAIGSLTLPMVEAAGTTHAASSNTQVLLTNPAITTVTFPASPTAPARIRVVIGNGRADNVINFNGLPHQDRTWSSDPTMEVDDKFGAPEFELMNNVWRLLK